jgi:hypothetical protein
MPSVRQEALEKAGLERSHIPLGRLVARHDFAGDAFELEEMTPKLQDRCSAQNLALAQALREAWHRVALRSRGVDSSGAAPEGGLTCGVDDRKLGETAFGSPLLLRSLRMRV